MLAARDGSDISVANDDTVDPGDRHDPTSRRCDEDLVGPSCHFNAHLAKTRFYVEFPAQFERSHPGNPFQHAACGCWRPPFFDDEEVEARSFADIPVEIDQYDVLQHRSHMPRIAGDEIEPVIILDRRIDRLRWNSRNIADGNI